jgi:hypothetical protein
VVVVCLNESAVCRPEPASSHKGQIRANRTCLIGHPRRRLADIVRIRTLTSLLVFVSTPSYPTPAPSFLSELPPSSHPAINNGSGLFGRLEICTMFRRQGRGRGYHGRSGWFASIPPSNVAHCVGAGCSRCYLDRRIRLDGQLSCDRRQGWTSRSV